MKFENDSVLLFGGGGVGAEKQSDINAIQYAPDRGPQHWIGNCPDFVTWVLPRTLCGFRGCFAGGSPLGLNPLAQGLAPHDVSKANTHIGGRPSVETGGNEFTHPHRAVD